MTSVIVLAAGKAERMNMGYNKILMEINGLKMYQIVLEKFKDFKNIFLVLNEEDFNIEVPKNVTKVIGGKTRGESVYNALKKVETKRVIIHDCARPFISQEMINKCNNDYPLYYFGVPAKDSIRFDNNNIDRAKTVIVQTPQGGDTDLFKEAYNHCDFSCTDDVSLVEKYIQISPVMLLGEYDNIKITTKDDVYKTARIGHSWDVHQMVEGRKLILGGVIIPYEKGLLGHSDADVLYHSIAEAILGALALGDLGKLFPDTDSINKDLDSSIIMKKACELMKNMGYHIGNVDAMVYAEKPKLSKYIIEMRENISKLLDTNIDRISVKATTYEKLGEIGKGLAIASETTLLLEKN